MYYTSVTRLTESPIVVFLEFSDLHLIYASIFISLSELILQPLLGQAIS